MHIIGIAGADIDNFLCGKTGWLYGAVAPERRGEIRGSLHLKVLKNGERPFMLVLKSIAYGKARKD